MADDGLNDKDIELAIAALDKQFGPNTVQRMGGHPNTIWPAYSTGALTLDLGLGIGGLPKGRVVELYGPESSGKSTLAMHVVAEVQRHGGICVYVDAEHALDPVYMRAIGVDVDELLIAQPDYGEQALEIVNTFAKLPKIDLIVVDSVAALTPKAELEGEVGDNHVGRQPRMMAQALRMINAHAAKNGVTILFINQIREKIGVMFGSPETTPGGRALKFYSSVRIDVRSIERLKDKATGEISGIRVKAKTVKNKMAPPFREAEFDIVYGKGIDNIGCLIDVATSMGIMKKSGAWYSYMDVQLGQGKPNTVEALASDLDLYREILGKVLETRGLTT